MYNQLTIPTPDDGRHDVGALYTGKPKVLLAGTKVRMPSITVLEPPARIRPRMIGLKLKGDEEAQPLSSLVFRRICGHVRKASSLVLMNSQGNVGSRLCCMAGR